MVMIILLDEIIAIDNKVNETILNKICEKLSYGFRKPKREKIKYLFEHINNNNLWIYVQTDLIFFKNTLDNVCFFDYSKENFEQFLKNLEYIEKQEFNKINNIKINYKNLMRIYEDSDDYALVFPRKKESILRVLTPVVKNTRPLVMVKL